MEEEEARLQMICPVITKRGVKGKKDDTLFGLLVCLYLVCQSVLFYLFKQNLVIQCVFSAQLFVCFCNVNLL